MKQYQKQTDKALSLFRQAHDELVKVNDQIRAHHTRNLAAIDEKHRENEKLSLMLNENDLAVEQLSKFITAGME